MVNPHLQKKQEGTLTLSQNAKSLFKAVYSKQNKKEPSSEEESKISVSELISKMAFYYEKIRNTVDYQEEYLLRKGAIERILKRQLIIEGMIKASKSEGIAKHLLYELIRAGYLPNNKVPEKKMIEVAELVEKHIKLRNLVIPYYGPSLENLTNINKRKSKKEIKKGVNDRNELSDWLLDLMASEIEENLGQDTVRETVVNNMYRDLMETIKPEDEEYEKDLSIQIYLGIHRNFLKFDEGMLSFILFKYYNGEWKNPSEDDIKNIAGNIDDLRRSIRRQLNHPFKKQLDKIIGRYTVYYSILLDLITADPEGKYSEATARPQAFRKAINETYTKKYKEAKSKLWRAAVRSIIYIFLTKSIFVVILEVPMIRWFGENVDPVALAINVSFPAVLLLVAVVFTRVSTEENAKKIIQGVEEIVFKENKNNSPVYLRKKAGFGKKTGTIFGIFYSITFLISFGAVIWVLDKIGFNWVSIIIFLFFLTFASFFAVRIRRIVQQYMVVERKENIFTFILDFFYIPIAAVGKWLSERFSRINVFIFVLDFIIEAPFKVFVEIAEQWTRYVRERREDLR
ncbi:MAG: hypothetical protein ACOCVY_01390 [Patescibacteria group bacterium]